ncbi:LytTr DNA-binding domain protein [compost metagenome]
MAHGYCGHEVLLEVSLSALLQRFPEQFTLLNRGHLVRTADLEQIEGESIHGCTVLVRGTAYPVARRRVRQIRQLLANKENRHA